MQVYRTSEGIVVAHEGAHRLITASDWDAWFAQDDLYTKTLDLFAAGTDCPAPAAPLAPIGQQEVWACGVTYYRSRTARMEESKDAGGGSFYDRVYSAERPELFFKATAQRVVGPGEAVWIRKDSKWNVPEPELTLAVSASGQINGYTIGNDMSSRDIEGENPLYLPQAKTYDRSAALGPCVLLLPEPISRDTAIRLKIERAGEVVFSDETDLNQLKRGLDELVGFLTYASSFKHGAFLMTGTGIIPADDFTLHVDDLVHIEIEGIGTLTNTVAQSL